MLPFTFFISLAFLSGLLQLLSKKLLNCIKLGVDCGIGFRRRNIWHLGIDGNGISWYYGGVVKQKMAVNFVQKFKVRVFL